MDPRNGTLSRAMRNRSVEMYFGKGNFWDVSLEHFFNDAFSEERVEESVLTWILSTSLGESLKLKAFDFSDNITENQEMYKFTEL